MQAKTGANILYRQHNDRVLRVPHCGTLFYVGYNTRMKKVLIAALLFAAVAGAAYFLLDSDYAASKPSVKEFLLTIHDRQLVGQRTLQVRQGDIVIISISANEEEEFHVHGYDRSVDLEPNVPSTVTIVADQTGRFPFELEHSKTEVGALEVHP